MMLWKFCLFDLAIVSAFEINVLHKPKIHKSFGEGSYVFNQPLYKHGIEGKYYIRLRNCRHYCFLDERESMGFGHYEEKDYDHYGAAAEYQKKEKIGNEFLHSYNDPIIDKFLTYLHQVYLQSQNEETARSFQVRKFTEFEVPTWDPSLKIPPN